METRIQIMLSVLSGELTMAEAARRHRGVAGDDQPLAEICWNTVNGEPATRNSTSRVARGSCCSDTRASAYECR